MERRYKLMAAMGVRNLAGFNRKIKDAQEAGKSSTTRCTAAKAWTTSRRR